VYISKATLKTGEEIFTFLKEIRNTHVYAAHQYIWRIFQENPDAKRDFIFRFNSHRSEFIIVSERRPIENPLFNLVTKDYKPKLHSGENLGFILTANPVVSKKINDRKNSSRHDVWMDAKKKAKKEKLKPQEIRKLCEERTKSWLISRAERAGFSLTRENVIVDGYIQHRFFKSNNSKNVRFSSVNFEGILTVTDVERFTQTLFKGIGPAKAFGCGLLLIRPV